MEGWCGLIIDAFEFLNTFLVRAAEAAVVPAVGVETAGIESGAL